MEEILFQKSKKNNKSYDRFISTYTKSERVKTVFEKCDAKQKHWLIAPEYKIAENDCPKEDRKNGVFCHTILNDGDDGLSVLYGLLDNILDNTQSICIDVTGFIRPTLLFLMMLLYRKKINHYDIIYAEPQIYTNREKTEFSSEYTGIKQIPGFEGCHNSSGTNLLIIGAGYENKLITNVAEDKKDSRKILIYGFPPLQADMFQENVLKVSETEESIMRYDHNRSYFASANDPFATANVLRAIVDKYELENPNTTFNLYLSPLSTKPHVVGFGLYYISERIKTASSIIFPFARSYAPETSTGVGRIWRYTIDIR
jgi:hypothetical protein